LAPKGMTTGSVLTRPIELTGGELHLNVEASKGSVRAELRSEHGTSVEGYAFDQGKPVCGDQLDARIEWNAQSGLPAGKHVLALDVEASTVYALWEE